MTISCESNDEEGTITVAAAGVIAALFTLCLVAAFAAKVVINQHRAQVAADMSAFSAAYALYTGQSPCAVGATVAARNGAHQEQCVTDEAGDVEVVVSVNGRSQRAKAGPL